MTQRSQSGKRWRIPNSKPWITGDEIDIHGAILASIHRGDFEIGSEVAAFERELAEYLGRKYVVCVSSGTAALELALAASGTKGARVGAFGFIATANAMERALGRVTFDSIQYDPVLGEVPDVSHLARDGGAGGFVRDACQAFGAKLPPSLADCYSFQINKPLTTMGGGCVATDDEALADKVRALANQGRDRSEWASDSGTNARMSDMQAALGRSQLRRVGEILERRRRVARWYAEALVVLKPWAQRGGRIPPARESWFLYPIELSNRDEVHAKMMEKGIQTRSVKDWLLPAHPWYKEKYGYEPGMFPEAERRAERTLLLPLYPELTLEQVQEVCAALEQCGARA